MTDKLIAEMSTILGEEIWWSAARREEATGPDRDAAQELFEDLLRLEASFNEIVWDVLENVRRSFDFSSG